MIGLKDVSKAYRTGELLTPVLENINLSIEQGEFLAIVGPSGSGKSTLLNLIGGLDQADKGHLVVLETELSKLSAKELTVFRSHHFGFIFQSFNLLQSLTVFENISFPLTTLLDEKHTKFKVEELLKTIDMFDQKEKYPDQLSGGQKQRVAVARALVVSPKIVFADEPTANLDSKTAQKVLSLMRDMCHHNKTTFIFSTHDPQIMALADRIVTLKDGQIASDERKSL